MEHGAVHSTGTCNHKVFDYLATLIKKLKEIGGVKYYNQGYRDASYPTDTHVEDEAKSFFSEFPELQNGSILIKDGISEATVRAIDAWQESKKHDPYYFYYLLEFFCELQDKIQIEDLLKSKWFQDLTWTEDGPREFEALNENVKETGIIVLPKVPCIYDEEEKLKFNIEAFPGIRLKNSNIYYYESERLKASEIEGLKASETFYQALHSVVNIDGISDVFTGNRNGKTQNKNMLTIAASPLTNQKDLLNVSCYRRGHTGYFSVNGLKDSVAERIRKTIETAAEKSADILIFPEMLGSEDTVTTPHENPFDSFLAEVADSLEQHGHSIPMMLLPTWWHNHYNELYVRRSPERIFCIQQKQFPFSYKDKYLEDLQNQERTIHMVHIPGLGRFAFPICRDFIHHKDYIDLMREQLWATFLLCPSYSEHKAQFESHGYGSMEFGCYTVWCNACGAAYRGSPAKYVGFVASPLLSGEQITYFEPQCKGKCGSDGVCLFLIDLDRNGTVQRCEHIYH